MKEKILEEFEKFINNDFDLEFGGIKKGKQETNRWIFCWDGEQDTDLPFDCACCLDNSVGNPDNCGCSCHRRIKKLQNFISQALDEYADWKIKECEKELWQEFQKQKTIHEMILDAISRKSLEEFIIWRDERKLSNKDKK